MKMRVVLTLIASSVLLCVSSGAEAATTKPTPASKRLADWLTKKKKMQVIACPAFMSSTKSGLASSVASPTTVCLKSGTVQGAYKGTRGKPPQASKVILSGKFDAGSPFIPVVGQQGDVQTDPFVVKNAPALISYRVTEGTFRTLLRISLMDAETGLMRQVLYRVRGEGEGHFAWNYPGSYYLKMQALPDPEAEVQPKFDISVEFVSPEIVGRVSKNEFAASRVALRACPSQIIDADGFKSYVPPSDAVCSTKSPEPAGVGAGAVNTTHNIFVMSALSESGHGGYVSLPFRIKKPTAFVYSVDDPSQFRGGTTMYLVNLSTNKRMAFVQVRGSIDETTTYINQPGDYYLYIDTDPYKPQENGDINWTFSVEGAF